MRRLRKMRRLMGATSHRKRIISMVLCWVKVHDFLGGDGKRIWGQHVGGVEGGGCFHLVAAGLRRRHRPMWQVRFSLVTYEGLMARNWCVLLMHIIELLHRKLRRVLLVRQKSRIRRSNVELYARKWFWQVLRQIELFGMLFESGAFDRWRVVFHGVGADYFATRCIHIQLFHSFRLFSRRVQEQLLHLFLCQIRSYFILLRDFQRGVLLFLNLLHIPLLAQVNLHGWEFGRFYAFEVCWGSI